MIVPAPPMHQYDDTPMMVSVLYWKKKKKTVHIGLIGFWVTQSNVALLKFTNFFLEND